MATVQLIAIQGGVAMIRKDDTAPVKMTWGELHESQQQVGAAGYVYRWLMREFCRCEYEQRQGREWQSPRREISDIVTSLHAQDKREAAEAEASRRAAQTQQDAEDARRKRDEEMRRVEEERLRTTADDPWWPIPFWEVPQGVRFDTPSRNQGQMVEVSYGTFGRSEAGSTDSYMRVFDHSDGRGRTYKRRRVG